MSSENAFTLCDYFDGAGRRVDRIYIANEAGPDATDKVREIVRSGNLERLLDAMMAEAIASDATTDLEDAALALNALLNEVAEKRVYLGEARRITSIGINFLKPVTIAEIMPALEIAFGGYAVSWARGIFRHLNLGTPRIH